MFWKKPEKSLLLMKEAVKISLILAIALLLIPIPYLFVLGMWGAVLSNSQFCVSLVTIFSQKVKLSFILI